MPKPVLGLVLGAVLGLVDGASAYLYPYPDVRAQIGFIIFASTLKGFVTGLVAGVVALKLRSLPLGIAIGLVVGLTLSYFAASGGPGPHYYFEIMIPGAILGAIAGFATQRYGRTGRAAHAAR